MCKKSILLLTLLTGCFLLNAQEAPERELIIWLKNGLLEVTEQKGNEWWGKISSPSINEILNKYEIEAIICPFPNYNPVDTLRILPDGKTHRLINLREICHIRLKSPSAIDSLFQELSTVNDIRLLEKPIQMQHHITEPDDILFTEQWALKNDGQAGGQAGFDVKATEAWDLWRGSNSTVIAVMEDGLVDKTHEELQYKIINNYQPLYSKHSTAVASIAAAQTHNNCGIAGVDWNAKLLSYYADPWYPDLLYEAYILAVDEGAHILKLIYFNFFLLILDIEFST